MSKSEKTLGWGYERVTRGDLVLVRKAIREGWGPTLEVQRAIALDIIAILTDDAAPKHLKSAAARTALAAVAENQRLGRLETEYRACWHLCVNWLNQHSPIDADSLVGKGVE